MKGAIYNYESWPRTISGDPMFTCTEDAIFYAHQIVDKLNERTRLVKMRRMVLEELKVMRAKTNPNLNRMMEIAVKGQFYRECLEEIERIEKEGE